MAAIDFKNEYCWGEIEAYFKPGLIKFNKAAKDASWTIIIKKGDKFEWWLISSWTEISSSWIPAFERYQYFTIFVTLWTKINRQLSRIDILLNKATTKSYLNLTAWISSTSKRFIFTGRYYKF